MLILSLGLVKKDNYVYNYDLSFKCSLWLKLSLNYLFKDNLYF